MTRRRLMAVTALILLVAAPVSADELRLNNGDRITGRTVSMVGGTLTFKVAGATLTFPWSDVASLSVDDPVYVAVGGNSPILTRLAPGDRPGYARLDPGGPVPMTDIVAVTFGSASAWQKSGGAGAGFVQTAGNTEISNVRVSLDLLLKRGGNQFTLNGAATRAKDRGVESARNWSGSAKYDRFITRRLFADVNTVLTNDRFRDIDLRSAYGVGAGLQVIDRPRVKLAGTGGVGVVHENFITIPDDKYTSAFESGNLQIELVPGRAQIFHLHDGYYQVTQGDKKFFRTQNGIRFSIVGGFVATLQEDFDFDQHPAPGRKQTDTAFALTLGYRF